VLTFYLIHAIIDYRVEVVKDYLDDQECGDIKEKKIVGAIFMNYYKRG